MGSEERARELVTRGRNDDFKTIWGVIGNTTQIEHNKERNN